MDHESHDQKPVSIRLSSRVSQFHKTHTRAVAARRVASLFGRGVIFGQWVKFGIVWRNRRWYGGVIELYLGSSQKCRCAFRSIISANLLSAQWTLQLIGDAMHRITGNSKRMTTGINAYNNKIVAVFIWHSRPFGRNASTRFRYWTMQMHLFHLNPCEYCCNSCSFAYWSTLGRYLVVVGNVKACNHIHDSWRPFDSSSFKAFLSKIGMERLESVRSSTLRQG